MSRQFLRPEHAGASTAEQISNGLCSIAVQVKACLQAAAAGKEYRAAAALKASLSDDMALKLELSNSADDEREVDRESMARKLSQKEVGAR